MLACVKVVTPSGGTVPFTETITGVNDATTGVQFSVRTMILLGGNTAGVNTLSYHGMASGNSAGDSGYHWDLGFMHDASQGSSGGGVCHDFNLKIASGADGYGYAFMDTWPDIFFGGYIAGFGYVHNVAPGQFDITWDRRDRSGDSKIVLCIGGSDYSMKVQQGVVDGAIATADVPQGLIQFTSAYSSSAGSGPAVTAAGGTGYPLGWASRDVNGTTLQDSGSQGGNDREFWTDRFNYVGAHVTAWGPSSFTVAGASGGGGALLAFLGSTVVVKAGRFTAPAVDGNVSFNMGLNARFVIVQSVGLAAASDGIVDTAQASNCVGFIDRALAQISYWTGDKTVGNGVPILGARYLSNSTAIRTGTPNAGSTTFANIGTITSISNSGAATAAFTNTDGTQPEVLWFAVGTESIPEAPILKSDGGGLDFDTVYDAYVKTRAVFPGGALGQLGHVRESYLTGRPTDATIQLTVHEDFDLRTPTAEVEMTGTGALVTKKFEASQDADIQVVQFKLGDAEPTDDLWSLDKFTVIRHKDGEA